MSQSTFTKDGVTYTGDVTVGDSSFTADGVGMVGAVVSAAPVPPVVTPSATIQLCAVTGKVFATADVLQTIADGATIDRSKLPAKYAIIAATSPAKVANVGFVFDGTPHGESSAPYALWSDIGGVLTAGVLALGAHTLTVSVNGGSPVAIRFTVIDSTPAPTPAPDPSPATGKPTAANTGVDPKVTLAHVPGFTGVSGKTYSNLYVNGTVNLKNLSNVTLINCVIDGGYTHTVIDPKTGKTSADGASYGVRCDGASNITIKNCEIKNVSSAIVYGDGYTAINNYVHNSGGDAFKCGPNCLVQGNYVTMLGWLDPTAHADGVQIVAASNVKILGNNFDTPNGVANTKCNSALDLSNNNGAVDNVDFIGNYCNWGNYSVIIDGSKTSAKITNVSVTNNIQVTPAQYGFMATHGVAVNASGNVDGNGHAVK